MNRTRIDIEKLTVQGLTLNVGGSGSSKQKVSQRTPSHPWEGARSDLSDWESNPSFAACASPIRQQRAEYTQCRWSHIAVMIRLGKWICAREVHAALEFRDVDFEAIT